jgi:predicted nucleic acid-binding protein
MKLNDIPSGEKIFIDANIFIYHFTGASEECKEFLKNCAKNQITAYSSVTVLAEVCHRLMAIEAVKKGLVAAKQPSLALQKNLAIVKKLSEYYVQITSIMGCGIHIMAPSKYHLVKSEIFRQSFGLLTIDSILPIYMEEAGTANLASADQIFTSIGHLNIYSPHDIQT